MPFLLFIKKVRGEHCSPQNVLRIIQLFKILLQHALH